MLKFYIKERKEFQTESNIKVQNNQAKKIAKKIARHFKIQLNGISFKKGKKSFAYANNTIKLVDNPSILIICHELAHLLEYQKKRSMRHNKALMKTISRLIKYCRKKNYWIRG